MYRNATAITSGDAGSAEGHGGTKANWNDAKNEFEEVMDVVMKPQPKTDAGAFQGRAAQPPVLCLEDLTKTYTEAGQERLILDKLDREFIRGEFVCLLGKSGSGKSTLLNLISGVDAPTGGRVIIYGSEQPTVLTDLSERERTLFRRRNLGIVFQAFNLIPTLTVEENVMLPAELAGSAEARDRAAYLLERVGLQDRLHTFPDRLSGGEQQRVAIARSLIHEPLLILADEPTGNLDEDTGAAVLELLLELTRDAGKTLIMATHATETADYADRVLHLDHGHLVSDRLWRERLAADRPGAAGMVLRTAEVGRT